MLTEVHHCVCTTYSITVLVLCALVYCCVQVSDEASQMHAYSSTSQSCCRYHACAMRDYQRATYYLKRIAYGEYLLLLKLLQVLALHCNIELAVAELYLTKRY
jgi:hypothetical protein